MDEGVIIFFRLINLQNLRWRMKRQLLQTYNIKTRIITFNRKG